MNYGFEDNKFYLDIPACSRPAGNMKQESDRRALEIAERGTKLMLGISSGVDSQSVLHSFYTQGIPLECVFFYMPGYNDNEYEQLQLVKKKYGQRIDIIDLDPYSIKDEVLDFAVEHKINPLQGLHRKFLSILPSDYDFIQMIHDPFVYVSPTDRFYFYHWYSSPEISRIRAYESLNRIGKFIPYGGTSEFLYSILNDDVYKSALYTHRYFDGNNLTKPNCRLQTVDRWDYYINPIIYGKYWKDELIYFPKYGGWESIDYLFTGLEERGLDASTWPRTHATAIPYFELLEHLGSNTGSVKRYYENVAQS
jgi:hypothetical protein